MEWNIQGPGPRPLATPVSISRRCLHFTPSCGNGSIKSAYWGCHLPHCWVQWPHPLIHLIYPGWIYPPFNNSELLAILQDCLIQQPATIRISRRYFSYNTIKAQ
ncbi:unnamed protein product [Umbelopsis ramanniana]